MNFRVGQKVICINDIIEPSRRFLHYALPTMGHVYTVRAIFFEGTSTGIRLEEITSIIHPGFGKEFGFCASRFRPVVERKTDISIFIKMLTPKQLERTS